jgi:hypothetical protein
MKVLTVAVGGSSLTAASMLSDRPSAAAAVSFVHLGGLLMYSGVKWCLRRQSHRHTLELMERAKDCQVRVVVDDTRRIEITPAGTSTPIAQASTSPDPDTKWMRCTRWVRRYLPP